MKLSVREAARLLSVSETKVYRWVEAESIPFVMIRNAPMFNRLELFEWAMAAELPISSELYEPEHGQPLTAALSRGGSHLLDGGLCEIATEVARDPAERDMIRAVIAARADAMFIANSGGVIAIPRARSPMICAHGTARVMHWWCEDRIVLAGSPVDVVFAIVSSTVSQHLQLVSLLAIALRDSAFAAAARQRNAFDELMAASRRFEQALELARVTAGAQP